jgi:hypothetical protein
MFPFLSRVGGQGIAGEGEDEAAVVLGDDVPSGTSRTLARISPAVAVQVKGFALPFQELM